ncbi:15-hydroxyprostaglandin dehydrogenase [Caligus rogercresseyi]|uniref:15-hydroxyprostaglandin dehydrogenase n=1 Tax=Caligus rogercresseyi TaxID=217165 RepID=A0A7T8GVL4_CALRO|nr:15-hydroxyprostaglandin dehydrogenase [Caligus rogercresseyi]
MNKFEVGDKTFLLLGALDTWRELTEFVHSRGAKVWITDTVPESEGIEQIGSKYSERWGYSTLDVRNEDEVTGAFQKCVDKFGRPDIVFNMSQVFGEEDWRNVYDVNVVR